MVVSKKKNTNEDKVGIFYFLSCFCSQHTDDHAFRDGGEGTHFQYIMDVHAMYLERHIPTTHRKQTNKKKKPTKQRKKKERKKKIIYKLIHNQNISRK